MGLPNYSVRQKFYNKLYKYESEIFHESVYNFEVAIFREAFNVSLQKVVEILVTFLQHY